MQTSAVVSNYGFDLAPKTWDLIRKTRSGTAVFMMPSGPIKVRRCAAEDRLPGQ